RIKGQDPAIDQWGGTLIGDGTILDDYDRACQVEDGLGVISNGPQALALVLADEPALTCYLAERNILVRWLAADSAAELIGAATDVLDDPDAEWEECGVWETGWRRPTRSRQLTLSGMTVLWSVFDAR
ncbi:Imm21 family immunity protein, partial [Cryptosporangium minutisporangium]